MSKDSAFPSNFLKFRLTVFVLLIAELLLNCSSFPRSEKADITADHRYLLLYKNEEGQLFTANLSVQSRYVDALSDLKRFRVEVLRPLGEKFVDRLKEIDQQTIELKKDSTSIVRRLGAALAIALIVPVPFAFETTLTVGLIYVTYKKITEKKEDLIRKRHVEDLIRECQKVEDSLETFKKEYLVPFAIKWERNFQEESNHFVNSTDQSDIRLLDSLIQKYSADKEWLKVNAAWELNSSQHHCSKDSPSENKPKIRLAIRKL
ncbi:hypothetical protein LEP1GSC050_2457 [Leptospira broomii serovar Hurstbridge str. 5399]|uniref:Uncharacterized protein n=1 Tax=Leptospira broomii serovar Hurstbridge str. 5399 TaxID=1049789 RepID=T0F4H0_9LEPT|nr:hypothetical protein [Leptospira broomii]EQA45995.1 hypothetical protein LEP1GSC050_2457 [Leptospira broomii serovar Hurstbridge str. 5399]